MAFSTLHVDMSEINTTILLNYLNKYHNDYEFALRALPDAKLNTKLLSMRMAALNMFSRIKKACFHGKLNNEFFQAGLMKIDWHIEFLWFLSSCNMINIPSYLRNRLNEEKFVVNFVDDLMLLFFVVDGAFERQLRIEMSNQLSVLVKKMSEDFTNNANLLLSHFFKQFCEQLERQDDRIYTNEIPLLNIVSDGNYSPLILKLTEQCFCRHGTTSLAAMASQDYYNPRDMTSTAKFIENASDNCKLDLLRFLLNCDDQSRINWTHLATFVHAVNKKRPSEIKAIIQELLEYSLQQFSKWHLYAVIILGKICCLKKSGVKLTYLQWFSSVFSSESHRPLNTVEKASFFLKAMTDVIYIEPAMYTKVYIHRVASVPSSCQAELSEYVQVAKSYLISINESVELGFFESTTEESSCSEQDVNCLIAQYKTNKKIPQHFLASINFRRQYFEREFLPKLMSSCNGKESDNHMVIKLLAGMGKITAAMLAKHDEACSRKSENH